MSIACGSGVATGIGDETVHPRPDRKHAERRIRKRDAVARLREGADGGIENVVGAAPDHDLIGAHARVLRERGLELRRIDGRIARHALRVELAQRARGGRRHAPAIRVVAEIERARRAVRS